MYKMVALDLDGTLLSSRQTISARNLEVLRKLAAQGVHICIATGRIPATARLLTSSLDFPYTIISCNGALVIEQPAGIVTYRRYLSAKAAHDVLAAFRMFAIDGRTDAITDDTWYISPFTEKYAADARRSGMPCSELPAGWAGEAAKVMVFTEPEQTKRAIAQLKSSFPDLNIVLSTPRLLEVMAPGVSKGQTLLWKAASLGLDAGSVVAFGDQMNDTDMLAAVGYGVAMGNASEDAKKAARHVTLHHDEDGVAVALESLFALAS